VLLRPTFWLLWVAPTQLAGFSFKRSSLADPTAIVGPIIDMVAISHDVEGTSYEELGDATAYFYYAFLPHLWSPAALPPHLLYHRAIELAVAPVQPISSCMISHRLPTSFRTSKKIEIEKLI
jgi:hypothetical protein